MTSSHARAALLLALAAGAFSVPAAPVLAQATGAAGAGDVELLGRHYGTRPPAAYYEMKAANPDAFTFSRAWKNRNPSLRRAEGAGPGGLPLYEVVAAPGDGGGALPALAAMGPREGGVSGTIRVPLVLGLFEDSPALPPFTREEVQREFFDGPNSYHRTITEFYDEISGGRIELVGETTDWERSSLTRAEVAGGESGLGSSSEVGGFIMTVLAGVEGVDWGRFDNDGPDGVPNSGDDDGYVDVLTIMHPTFGAECVGDRNSDYVWSHKWNLQTAAGQAFVTDTDRTGGYAGEKIRISDYTIQPVYACPPGGSETPTAINEIGVLAHELGHGFGLPDLYDTNGNHRGIGRWGLMGSGSWGCSLGSGPERPCHMSAWSKEQLGWAEVETLPPGTDLGTLAFEPVETSGKVYRFDAPDDSGEYLLLENRRRIGFDESLIEEGLLVWHVDPAVVNGRWPSNSVNNDGEHMGVFLRQADGENDLGDRFGNSGDDADPFPGSTAATAFHAGSAPGAWTWSGEPFGLTLTEIALEGDDVTARATTRSTDVTLVAEGGGAGAAFAVDGSAVEASQSFAAAPFQSVVIEANGGGEISDGVRTGFVGWTDAPDAGRERAFVVPPEDVVLTAAYGGTEVRARVSVEGEAFGVPPGELVVTPAVPDEDGDLWFPQGSEVTLEAVANGGYDFERWTGAGSGGDNPLTLSLDEPVEVGAVFALTYGFEGATHDLPAATEQDIRLVAENATGPVSWTWISGALPDGMAFHADGRITGVAYETGTFTLGLKARDPSGLEATGELRLDVAAPVLGLDALAAPFLLTGGSLSSLETVFLDRNGNDNGAYDLGDFRAWVLAHPDLPATAAERAVVRALVPAARFHPGGGR